MGKYKHQHRNLINRTFGTILEIWQKGVPIVAGEFTFKTAERQEILLKKYKKKRRKPHYDITFDIKDISLSNSRGKKHKIKMFRLNKRQIAAMKAVVNR